MKEQENHIESLITKKISGSISSEEEKLLTEWLVKSPKNEDYFEEIKQIYSSATRAEDAPLPKIDLDNEWQRFKASVEPKIERNTYQTNWLRIAASVVVISVLGYLIWTNTFQSKNVTVLASTSGEIIILPDSTEVTLNKGASITYPRKFSKSNRIVIMNGEAFFEVTRNENKPFKVDMGLSSVEVLGTSFNISADEDNDLVEVVVNTGKVKFIENSTEESVILTKGEKGTLMKTNKSISKDKNKNVNFMAWKTRKLVFNDIELDNVIQTLNKLYEQQITFSTDISKNCKVTVSFDNQSIEAILSVLELTLDLEYKKTGDIIEVVKTGC